MGGKEDKKVRSPSTTGYLDRDARTAGLQPSGYFVASRQSSRRFGRNLLERETPGLMQHSATIVLARPSGSGPVLDAKRAVDYGMLIRIGSGSGRMSGKVGPLHLTPSNASRPGLFSRLDTRHSSLIRGLEAGPDFCAAMVDGGYAAAPISDSTKVKERKKKKEEEEEEEEKEGNSATRPWRRGRGLFDTRLLIATHDSSRYYYSLCSSDVDVATPRSSLTRERAQGLDDPAKDNCSLDGATKEND
ncbi:hypothetical protein CFIO01_10651 [Colletotrichum fioriniae PJ7]|uniref:Uncharacterized protein n=1 Tax=Colletotrichum fioriniae PJ7 TaxID=1445577 RepID=A0A010RZ48_9PEZI|nr:hypothetical protein CFIO01_10651 [Colletotrichum fioriniae PJ7]